MVLGRYPTPVERKEVASGELWVKRDDLTSVRYGGNKVRKLERVLARVRAFGARRIVTVGAAGSHHALATALYARDFGIDVEVVLVPQRYSCHVVENLRVTASLARIFPATSFAHAAAVLVDRVACGSYYVPAGGSTRDSTHAYAEAAAELLAQVELGELPLPAQVIVPLGSGGTAAGLAVGFTQARCTTRVVGVLVSEPRRWVERRARRLAAGCWRELVPEGGAFAGRLEIEADYLGAGYGEPSLAGARALEEGGRLGLTLDATYTAKTFAAALDRLAVEGDGPILFWHTLSSAPMDALVSSAPTEAELHADVRALQRVPP